MSILPSPTRAVPASTRPSAAPPGTPATRPRRPRRPIHLSPRRPAPRQPQVRLPATPPGPRRPRPRLRSTARPDPPQLLFWLPVTKPWLRQLVLGLTLICHSSLRGVHELLADLFDYPLSLGIGPQHPAPGRRHGTPPQRPAGSRRRPHRRPRRDLPGRPARAGRRRCRLDLLLPAQPRGASRRRHLGRATAGVDATAAFTPTPPSPISPAGLRAGQARGLARRALSRRCLPRLADGHCRWSATWRIAPTTPSPPAANSKAARPAANTVRAARMRRWRPTALRPRRPKRRP